MSVVGKNVTLNEQIKIKILIFSLKKNQFRRVQIVFIFSAHVYDFTRETTDGEKKLNVAFH